MQYHRFQHSFSLLNGFSSQEVFDFRKSRRTAVCWPLLMSRKCRNELVSVAAVTVPGFRALVLGGACVNTEHFLSLMCKNELKQRTLKCFLLPAGDAS